MIFQISITPKIFISLSFGHFTWIQVHSLMCLLQNLLTLFWFLSDQFLKHLNYWSLWTNWIFPILFTNHLSTSFITFLFSAFCTTFLYISRWVEQYCIAVMKPVWNRSCLSFKFPPCSLYSSNFECNLFNPRELKLHAAHDWSCWVSVQFQSFFSLSCRHF